MYRQDVHVQLCVFDLERHGISLPFAIAGREQEALARQAGFRKAVHYEVGFGLMGVLVASV